MVDGSTQATIPRRASQPLANQEAEPTTRTPRSPMPPLLNPFPCLLGNLRSSPDFLHSLYCRLLVLLMLLLAVVACCLAGCLFTAKSNKQQAANSKQRLPAEVDTRPATKSTRQLSSFNFLVLFHSFRYVSFRRLFGHCLYCRIGFVIFNFALVSRSAPLLIISLKVLEEGGLGL